MEISSLADTADPQRTETTAVAAAIERCLREKDLPELLKSALVFLTHSGDIGGRAGQGRRGRYRTRQARPAPEPGWWGAGFKDGTAVGGRIETPCNIVQLRVREAAGVRPSAFGAPPRTVCLIREGRLKGRLPVNTIPQETVAPGAGGGCSQIGELILPHHRFVACSSLREIAGNRDPWAVLRRCEGPRLDATVASDPGAPSHFAAPASTSPLPRDPPLGSTRDLRQRDRAAAAQRPRFLPKCRLGSLLVGFGGVANGVVVVLRKRCCGFRLRPIAPTPYQSKTRKCAT
jgi:hypothetical protein